MTNREDIISMAREAWHAAGEGWVIEQWFHDRESALTRFADLVAVSAKAEERELCAKECKFGRSSADIEQAIRARGETE
jgi:regulator of sigma D